ncbi:heterokaryon incompatibility protein-domain-containing protein [Nemania abortiva]|nr:heterokaryon incompatibility protein-domain-containing protein [Nemania abortiva]
MELRATTRAEKLINSNVATKRFGIEPLRLVDVRTGKVEPGRDVPYATISYVWSQWTRVENLLDAIRPLCRQMGLHHVWIDALCINQDDAEEKRNEITKMGEYYARSTITLAMVPEMEVSRSVVDLTTERKLDSRAVSLVADIGTDFVGSVWNSRVWTFQEAALAQNMLFLCGDTWVSGTDFYVCLKLQNFCAQLPSFEPVPPIESLKVELETEIEFPRSGFDESHGNSLRDKRYHSGIKLDRVDGGKTMAKFASLDRCWQQAGVRHCTNVEDIVNGFLGLLVETVSPISQGTYEYVMREALKCGIFSTLLLDTTPSQVAGCCWMPLNQGARLPKLGLTEQGYEEEGLDEDETGAVIFPKTTRGIYKGYKRMGEKNGLAVVEGHPCRLERQEGSVYEGYLNGDKGVEIRESEGQGTFSNLPVGWYDCLFHVGDYEEGGHVMMSVGSWRQNVFHRVATTAVKSKNLFKGEGLRWYYMG